MPRAGGAASAGRNALPWGERAANIPGLADGVYRGRLDGFQLCLCETVSWRRGPRTRVGERMHPPDVPGYVTGVQGKAPTEAGPNAGAFSTFRSDRRTYSRHHRACPARSIGQVTPSACCRNTVPSASMSFLRALVNAFTPGTPAIPTRFQVSFDPRLCLALGARLEHQFQKPRIYMIAIG
jgi:hypothetical protein